MVVFFDGDEDEAEALLVRVSISSFEGLGKGEGAEEEVEGSGTTGAEFKLTVGAVALAEVAASCNEVEVTGFSGQDRSTREILWSTSGL